jgi:integrase
VKDIDFDYGQIMVRDGKGMKDRVTMLPGRLRRPLKEHMAHTKAVHSRLLYFLSRLATNEGLLPRNTAIITRDAFAAPTFPRDSTYRTTDAANLS